MMRREWMAVCSVAITGALALSARADTVEDLEKKLTEIIGKQKSGQYKIKTEMTMEGTKSDAMTTQEIMRKGDRWMMRTETKSKTGDMENTTLTLFDGETQWMVMEGTGFKQVMKQKYDAKAMFNPYDIKRLFAEFREHFDLKMLPDEKVGGHDCWVLEKTPKGAGTPGMAMTKIVEYYDKSNGTAAKIVSGGGDSKYRATTTLEEVKIDAPIDPERFKFKVPEGAQVIDMDAKREAAEANAKPKETPAKP